LLGTCAFGAPALGSATGLDRAPGPSRAHAPAARASSPLGDFARRDPDCDRVGEARRPAALTLSAAGRAATAAAVSISSSCSSLYRAPR